MRSYVLLCEGLLVSLALGLLRTTFWAHSFYTTFSRFLSAFIPGMGYGGCWDYLRLFMTDKWSIEGLCPTCWAVAGEDLGMQYTHYSVVSAAQLHTKDDSGRWTKNSQMVGA